MAAPHRPAAATIKHHAHEDLVTGIWYVVGFVFAGTLFVFGTIGLAWLISHRTRGDSHKGYPYESGIDTYGDTRARFGISFYIYALIFVGILLFGLAYAWRKGVLTWR